MSAPQQILSLIDAPLAANRVILNSAAGIAPPTPAPALPTDGYNVTNSAGILHLEADVTLAGAPAGSTVTIVLWFLEPGLSGQWRRGVPFVWDLDTTVNGSSTATFNIQGKTQVFLQVLAKAVLGNEIDFWGGVNTVPGA